MKKIKYNNFYERINFFERNMKHSIPNGKMWGYYADCEWHFYLLKVM